MKKWPFLAPLAVSVAALIGGTTLPAHPAIASEKSVSITNPASPIAKIDQLVLVRSDGALLGQTDHSSHASHESHSSHSSHSSHASGS
jgi:hypothetical protein